MNLGTLLPLYFTLTAYKNLILLLCQMATFSEKRAFTSMDQIEKRVSAF